MRFDYTSFFQSINVPFVTEGKNTKRGWISIACPFCGNDPSEHLGCDPSTGFYGCLRNREHRGNATVLVQKLTGCGWDEAKRITGGSADPSPSTDTFEAMERELSYVDKPHTRLGGYKIQPLPKESEAINPGGIAWNYLRYERKYPEKDIPFVCEKYRLNFVRFGEYKQRIILPILLKKDLILGFQARAVAPAKLRYISYPGETVKKLLFNYSKAFNGGKALVVVEGPFGAVRCDYYGQALGIRAVALMGVSFTENQVSLLYRLAPKFEKIFILFDPKAEATSFDLASRLSMFGAESIFLPEGVNGPDDLENDAVVPFLKSVCGL